MTIFYVYVTDQCKEDAYKHGALSDIENLAEKIEKDQSDCGLEHYPPPYRKKVMGRKGRLVIEERRFDNDTVLCFVRYFIRGSSEYDKNFCKDTELYHKRNKLSTDEVKAFLSNRKTQPINKKPPPSTVELTYIQPENSRHDTDEGAYLESYDWFERISQDWAKDNVPRY